MRLKEVQPAGGPAISGLLEGGFAPPERVAIEADGQPIFAEDLRRQAEQLAQVLGRFGPCRVAVHAVRPESILSALAAVALTKCELLLARELYTSGDPFWQACEVRAVFDEHLELTSEHSGKGRPERAAILLATSGTTGQPKVAIHELAGVLGRIRTQQSGARWLLTYHPGSFAGLQVLLTAFCTSSVLVAYRSQVLAQLAQRVVSERITHLSGTPTFCRALLLALGGETQRAVLRQITLGGEAVDQGLLQELHRCFPQARIVHIYASTEAGALFAVKDLRAGFPAQWLETGIEGCRLRIRDGVLEVLSPRAMKGYLGQAAAAHCLEDGWLVTGDLVEVAGDRVQFRGRIDNVINVGGTKVLPEEVESVLLEVSGVREARVYGVPNPMTGAILAADVVLAEGLNEAEGRQRIFSLLSGRLAAFKVPRLYRFVKEMDINEAGKKVRSMV